MKSNLCIAPLCPLSFSIHSVLPFDVENEIVNAGVNLEIDVSMTLPDCWLR